MSSKDKWIISVYVLIAAIALPATWIHNIAFMNLPDNGGVSGFIAGGYANPAAASLTNDLGLIAMAAVAFMIVEGRRVGVRFVPAYVILSFLVAVSVTFPLFLAVRHWRVVRK
ncbi:MAG: DUF2834 domain-containing protein [Myxococcales bacterium]|nr:DUF2834 domain-containing protein [Myxococcales bacterium]